MASERKPLVLFVAPFPPPYGGIAMTATSLVDSDLQTRYTVSTLNLAKPGEERERVHKIALNSFTHSVRLWLQLAGQMLSSHPDVVYVVSTSDYSYLRDFVLMGTARWLGAHVICHLHGRRVGRLFGGRWAITELALRMSSISFDRIVFLTNGLLKSFGDTFPPSKMVVVPNFVDAADFPARAFTRHSNPPHAVFVGRLSKAKGIFDLIAAAAILNDTGVKILIDVVGAGENEEDDQRVRFEVKSKGLDGVIQFHGIKTGRDKLTIMTAADIFVLPSYMEIFPVSILEAFACGLPVVSTTIGAIPEIVVEGRNGMLVTAGDIGGLAAALKKLLLDESLCERIGRANREAAETLYNKCNVTDKVRSLIDSVLVN